MILSGLGPEHPHLATSLENYAALLRKTDRAEKAAELEARAKAIRAKYERADPALADRKYTGTISDFWREGSSRRPANGGLGSLAEVPMTRRQCLPLDLKQT